MNICRINLNLLVSLDVLLKEKSVTRAAKKLFLTQAAMSNNLKKLREIFNNQLLIRDKNKMELTAYAKELQPKLHRALEDLESLIQTGQVFDPLSCNKTFNIGVPSHLASLILPRLMPILKQEAPGIKINIKHLTQIYDSKPFEMEEYDIGIGRSSSKFPLSQSICKHLLINDPGICVVNPNHPLAKKNRITLKDYISYQHIAWRTDNPEFPSIVDQFLISQGCQTRDSVLHVPYVETVFRVIENSNYLIGNVTQTAGSLLNEKYNCVIKKSPLKMVMAEFYIVWHARHNDNLAHQWLRNKIIDIGSFQSC